MANIPCFLCKSFVLGIILLAGLTGGMPVHANQSFPGLDLTIRDLEIPQKIGNAIRGGQPIIKPIPGEKVSELILQYKANDASKALIRIQVIVPNITSAKDLVTPYFEKHGKRLVQRADKRGHKKISSHFSGLSFESIYKVAGRNLHFNHSGRFRYDNAYFIDIISNIDHPWTSSAAEDLALTLLYKIFQAKHPKGRNVPGHNIAVYDLGFPDGIGELKLKGKVELMTSRPRHYSMVWVDYTFGQPQPAVILRLFIPAPGSDDLDRAAKPVMGEYSKFLAAHRLPGVEEKKNEKWDTGFFISLEHKTEKFRQKIMGNIFGSYGYTITVKEKIESPVPGIDTLKQITEGIIKKLERVVRSGCKIKRTGPFEPGDSDCFEPDFPDLPRANLLVENTCSYSIYIDCFGEPIKKDGKTYIRHAARVIVPANSNKLIRHALPVGRKTFVYIDNEKWYGEASHIKWTKYINNDGQETCRKKYTLVFKDSDFSSGAEVDTSTEKKTTKQTSGEWQTIVE